MKTQKQIRKREYPVTRTIFEPIIDDDSKRYLNYFIGQELAYYNLLVDNLNRVAKAFPSELINLTDREFQLWDICAEYSINPQKFIKYPKEQWPENLQQYYSLVKDQNDKLKITPFFAGMLRVPASPARIHPKIRKSMAHELLSNIIHQAKILHEERFKETMKVPVQLYKTHNLNTKRHLQIHKSLVSMKFNQDKNCTEVSIPYTKLPLIVNDYDLTKIKYRSIILRAPNPREEGDDEWKIDFRDFNNYATQLTDNFKISRF